MYLGGDEGEGRQRYIISEICATLFSLRGGFSIGRGRESGVYMASKKQVRLYWCTTDDHDEDWFIFANSARQARSFHENYEGYGKGDASSRLIVSNVTLEKFQNGTPPCHAQFQDLFQIGFQDAGTIPDRRKVRFEGKTYTGGHSRVHRRAGTATDGGEAAGEHGPAAEGSRVCTDGAGECPRGGSETTTGGLGAGLGAAPPKQRRAAW